MSNNGNGSRIKLHIPTGDVEARLRDIRNMTESGLKIAQGVEAAGTYLWTYLENVPGIGSISCSADIIIEVFKRIEGQLDCLEKELMCQKG